MSDNPLTRAVSPTSKRPQTPAPKSPAKGKIVKQSKTKIEYRNPMSELGEEYLGACNHPFTKAQYERLVRSPKMPPSFLSVRASQPKDGKVCLYASSVFGGIAAKGLIGKLKRSCAKVTGKGSEASCKELIGDLKRRIPKPQKEQKTPSLHDPRALNPFSWDFVKDRWRGGCGGFDFGVGMAVVAGGMWLIKKAIDRIWPGGGNDGNKTGDPEDTPKPSAPESGANMVAGALGVLAGLVDDLDDVDLIPFPPIVPAMDTIDQNYILDPTSAAQAAYHGMTAAEWSAAAAPTSYVISWAAVLAGLDSAATWVEEIWNMNPHSKSSADRWADRNIGEPMAQAGRNMAASILAAKAAIVKEKPKNMPMLVFAGLVVITAPLWIPALAINSIGSLFMGPALQEMMDKRPGNRRTPGPA